VTRRTAAARWLLRLAAPVAILLSVAALHSATRPPDRLAIREARFAAGGETLERSIVRSLPDAWSGGGESGWYRLAFDASRVVDAPGAIYLPTVTMNAAIYLNGVFLGDGGRFASPLPRNTNRPLLFEIPAEALVPGENHVDVHVVTEPPGRGALGPVFVGSFRELVPFARRSHGLRVEALWGLAVVRLVIAAFTLALWARRRRDRVYGWYAALTIGFVVADLNQVVVQPPVPAATWYWLWYVATGWIAILAVRLITSFVGEEDPAFGRALWIFGIGGTIVLGVLAALDRDAFHRFGGSVWLPGSFVTGCFAVVRLRPALRRHPDDVEIEVAYAIVVTVVAAVLHDLFVDVGMVSAHAGRYAPYAAAVAIVGMGWVLLRRFVGALRRSETMVRDLEERVRRKRDELDEAQRRIREIDHTRIVHEEHERVLRDVQDGIGARLVSTLARIEQSGASTEAAAAAIRAALEDLRLMIDSLDPFDGDLLPVIGMLRSRLQPRLDAAGIRVEWQVEDLPPIADFPPWKVLRTLRILRGAIADSLERTGTRTITVRTGAASGANGDRSVHVEIVDDGTGGPSAASMARAAEMESFALEIGATLQRSQARTPSLRLTIPV
jgi:hypothetical protein